MSVALDVNPEILLAGQGLHITVRNPTNTQQDITVNFYADTTLIAQLVVSAVGAGESKNILLDKAHLDLSGYAGRTLTAYPSIPTPGTGVYLLGTSQAPGTKGNAVAVKVASSKKITVVDEKGAAVAYPQVTLFDQRTAKAYSYTGDKDGVCIIPENITDAYGAGWLIEAYKFDPSRRVVQYVIQKYDWTDTQLTVYTGSQLFVELQLNAPKDSSLDMAVRNALAWLPSPLRDGITAIANALGYLHTTVINAVFNWIAYVAGAKAGVRVTSVKWDADRLKITVAMGVGSPIAGAGVIAFLKFLFWMFLALGLSYFVDRIISYLTGAKQAEETSKQEATKKDLIDKLTEQYNKGNISKETYEECLKLLAEAIFYQRDSTPMAMIDYGLMGLISLVLVLLVMSLIKSVRG